MNKQKAYYPTIKADSIVERYLETERFEKSFSDSASGYQSFDAEFHWMAHASYNLASELLNKTTKK